MPAWSLFLPDADATERLGHWLGQTARPGDVLLLHGNLGAGKTTLVRGLARGLALDAEVTSPTFALVQTYGGHPALHHLDLYRLETAEVLAAGLDEYWEAGDAVCAIEWPERLRGDGLDLRPAASLALSLTAEEPEGRQAAFQAETGGRPSEWLAALETVAREAGVVA
ncbi:MAG: tRNA (adenosine(37)-N6)-threonylcarbamoyltransferase complex ATPase subunit type 1 TsaE [Candidatus Sericytochromatia bacterium]|nr:tRNA (adenosine(37)-N6)-threonylcarbamoyltransferase complex ATPase subunit type 1 TsaE [Candidatus Sericytochromatia bacterium]